MMVTKMLKIVMMKMMLVLVMKMFSAAVFFSLWLLLHFGLCVVHCIKVAICSGRGRAMTLTGRRKLSEVASCFLLLSC